MSSKKDSKLSAAKYLLFYDRDQAAFILRPLGMVKDIHIIPLRATGCDKEAPYVSRSCYENFLTRGGWPGGKIHPFHPAQKG